MPEIDLRAAFGRLYGGVELGWILLASEEILDHSSDEVAVVRWKAICGHHAHGTDAFRRECRSLTARSRNALPVAGCLKTDDGKEECDGRKSAVCS